MRRITSVALRSLLRRMRMSDDALWITSRIAEARRRHVSVTNAVATRMEDLLKGQLSDGRLSSTELASVAKALIASMVAPSPKAETTQ